MTQYLTAKRRVLGFSRDSCSSYTTQGIVDVLHEPIHWQKFIQLPNNNLIELPQYVLDFPIRTHLHYPYYLPPNLLPLNLTHPNFEIKLFKPIPTQKSYTNPIYQLSIFDLTPDVPWCTNPNSKINQYCAYRKRLAGKRPPINNLFLTTIESITKEFLTTNFKPLPYIENDMDKYFKKWLEDNKTYVEGRKKQLRLAYYLLSTRNHPYRLTNKDYTCKSFIKRELYEEAKNARIINSRTDSFKVMVGPFIHYLERIMYPKQYDFRGQKSHFFAKGISPRDLPSNIMRLNKYPFFLETDYSSFEGSFDPCYVDVVECELWRYMFKNNPIILSAIMNTYLDHDKNGRLQPRIQNLESDMYHAKVRGARMSGEMWTSLGNGFSNLMNMITICTLKGIKFDGMVEGDDGLFGLTANTIDQHDFESLGFSIKMKYAKQLLDTDFCGNYINTETENVILPPEQIVRLAWTHSSVYFKQSHQKKLALLRMKVMSTYVMGKNTPILGPLCYKIMHLIGPGDMLHEVSSKWYDQLILENIKNSEFDQVSIKDSDRQYYNYRFGITISDQISLEKIIAHAKNLKELYLPYQFMTRSSDMTLRHI